LNSITLILGDISVDFNIFAGAEMMPRVPSSGSNEIFLIGIDEIKGVAGAVGIPD
jgi:hypothetical protein